MKNSLSTIREYIPVFCFVAGTKSVNHREMLQLLLQCSLKAVASLKFICRFRFCLVFFCVFCLVLTFVRTLAPIQTAHPHPPHRSLRAVWRSSCHRQHLGFRQRSTVFLSALGISQLQQLSTFFESLPSTCSIAALLCNERCRFSRIVFEGLTLTSRHYRREDPGTHHQP